MADLEAETAYLARRLAQPVVRTAGATGLVNSTARSAVWVHDEVHLPDLLAELAVCPVTPELMAPEHLGVDPAVLASHGWTDTGGVLRLRRDLRWATPCRPDGPPVRPARTADLPAVRALSRRAFESTDDEEFLPDDLLEVPGMHLLLALGRAGEPVGVAGVRLRWSGSLLFGLAVAPEHRGRGLATALVTRCLDWAARHGAGFALADVEGEPPVLWSRLDFRSTGRWRRCTRG